MFPKKSGAMALVGRSHHAPATASCAPPAEEHGGADAAVVFAQAAAIDETFRSLKRTGTLLVALVNDRFPCPSWTPCSKALRCAELPGRGRFGRVFRLAQSGWSAPKRTHALDAVPELLRKWAGELMGRAVISSGMRIFSA
jgi:hypothetical protein